MSFLSVSTGPSYKDPDFLRQKYVVEQLPIPAIADLSFSSKKTIRKYLALHEIPMRSDDLIPTGPLKFGERKLKSRVVRDAKALETIKVMIRLREDGFSYQRIADVLNAIGYRPFKRGGKWYGNSVYRVLFRSAILRSD